MFPTLLLLPLLLLRCSNTETAPLWSPHSLYINHTNSLMLGQPGQNSPSPSSHPPPAAQWLHQHVTNAGLPLVIPSVPAHIKWMKCFVLKLLERGICLGSLNFISAIWRVINLYSFFALLLTWYYKKSVKIQASNGEVFIFHFISFEHRHRHTHNCSRQLQIRQLLHVTMKRLIMEVPCCKPVKMPDLSMLI